MAQATPSMDTAVPDRLFCCCFCKLTGLVFNIAIHGISRIFSRAEHKHRP